jgi:FHS family Na+ dependent glucose MFS transporter 1
MQGIHFMFGVGAFVAPILAEPFLSTNSSLEYNETTTLIPDNITTTTTNPPTTTPANWTEPEVLEASNATESTFSSILSNHMQKFHLLINHITKLTKVQFAYLTIALFLQLVSFMALVTCCLERPKRLSAQNVDMDGQYIIKKETMGFRIQILVLLAIFFFLYVGMEVAYGGLIMIFSVKQLGWSKEEGTWLTSVFWGSFAASRGAAIFISRWCSPAVMLIADLLLCAISMIGLLMTLESNPTMLWYCTAVLGVGMASIFPTGITWAERYLRVTGKAASVFVVGSALGEMAIPALVGFLFNSKSPKWLLYIVLAGTIASTIVYIIMQNLASNMGERYQKLMNGIDNMSIELGGNELEMDDVPLGSPHSPPQPKREAAPSTSGTKPIKAPPRNKGTKKD